MSDRWPRPSRPTAAAGRVAAVLCLAVQAGLAADDRVTRVDGTGEALTVAAISAAGVVAATGAAAVALDELWRIERAPLPAAVGDLGERVIFAHGEIPVRSVTVQDGVCRFDWAGGNDARVDQAAVRALVFAAGATPAIQAALDRALDKPLAADQVLAWGPEDVPVTIAGRVRTIGATALGLEYEGAERTISRAKAGAVVLARAPNATQPADRRPWKVTLAGDAWVEPDDLRLADGVLTLTLGASALAVPWAAVCRVEHRGPQVRFLSGLEPVRATAGAVLTLPLPWQRDRSAMNRPLRLHGEVRDTGLGTHAPTELVFDLPDHAQRFLAVVGLDEEYGRGGDCLVSVQLDEREAFRSRLRGTDPPVPVDLDVRNGRRLTLRAEPGENYDLGDHVNWYDARLLLRPPGRVNDAKVAP